MKWKDIAKIYFKDGKFELSLKTYTFAKYMSTIDISLSRDINSNISLLCVKLNKYKEAKDAAIKCIQLDPSWYKVNLFVLFLMYFRVTNFRGYKFSRISRFLQNLIGHKQRIALQIFKGKVIREN